MTATATRSVLRSSLASATVLAALALAGCAQYTRSQPATGATGMPARISQGVVLTASMNGAQEVPANTRTATGKAEVRFDKDTRVLTYQVTYIGLSGPVTGAHIHGPAAPGVNGPVVVPFGAPADGTFTGTATLNPTQAGDLLAGLYYVNVHTAAHPGGEIRGQLRLQP